LLIAEARARGEKPKPAEIQQAMAQVERREAALQAIEAVQKAGGTAVYRSVNLLDDAGLAQVVAEVREKHGRVDVLVHAGGIEISKGLADKPVEQFALVFDIKADGMFSLLHAIGDMPLGATVVFSSVAGRFGNSGQTDYSAANDLLCKITSYLRHNRPATQAIAVDWTAWGGIGMATRGSIPTIMKAAGIDMLPPEIGIPVVRQELTSGYRGEIVMAGSLGMMGAPFDETGGLAVELVNDWLRSHKPPFVLVGEVSAAHLNGGWQISTTLDPRQQPFLYDHAMEGTPLLPGVMGTEAFAQLARVALPAGYVVQGVANEQFHNPFKFYRMEPQTLHLDLALVVQADGSLRGLGTLRSVRVLTQPGLPPQEKIHFTAEVLIGQEVLASPIVPFTPPTSLPLGAEQIYKVYFHGPAYQVLTGVLVEGNTAVGQYAPDLPANTNPATAADLLSPRLIELCFQTAGIWQMENDKLLALPAGLGAVISYAQPENGTPLYALVTAKRTGDDLAFDAYVVDETGKVYVALQDYRTIALPGEVVL
jgi:hypothetical protein